MDYFSVGQSWHPDAYQAGCQAVQQALMSSGHTSSFRRRKIAIAIVFASPNYPQKPLLHGVSQAAGKSCLLVGCTSATQITRLGVSRHSVVVMLVWAGSCIAANPILVSDLQHPTEELSHKISQEVFRFFSRIDPYMARVVRANEHLVTVRPYSLFLFGSGPSDSFLQLVNEVGKRLGPTFQVIGSMAEGNDEGKNCYQYLNAQLHQNAIVGFLLVNRTPTSIGVNDGWSPHGPDMVVTRAHGTVLQELDGMPAGKVMQRLFQLQPRVGEQNGHTLPMPFGSEEDLSHAAPPPAVFPPDPVHLTYESAVQHSYNGRHRAAPVNIGLLERSNNRLLPHVGRASAHDALILNESLPEGALVRWMSRTPHDPVAAARYSAQQAVERLGNARPSAALLLMSSEEIAKQSMASLAQELVAIREVIGQEVPILGFSTGSDVSAKHHLLAFANQQRSVLYLVGA